MSRELLAWVLDRLGVHKPAVMTDLSPYVRHLPAIRAAEDAARRLTDKELRSAADEVRRRVRRGEPAARVRNEAFGLAGEAAARATGLRPFDVQYAGAMAMADGHVAQMATGEGKTLVAVLPAFLHSLGGEGVHVLTVNDYLAERDAQWMGPAYRALGVTVDWVAAGMGTQRRRRAYQADVTYATANEAGFDFLRDNLATDPGQVVHRELGTVLIDEVDSLLIDEARVPLVVAGGSSPTDEWVDRADQIVRSLGPPDARVDRDAGTAALTEAGIAHVEALLGGRLGEPRHEPVFVALHYALQAHLTLRRDVDYVVIEGVVHIVDAFKGRVAQRRRWPDGLQSAVEVKEGVPRTPEAAILSMISFQDLARLYTRRAGMTATAVTSAQELSETYGLRVVEVPPNSTCVRIDQPDVVFATLEAKHAAVVRAVAAEHALGRPVLVGTGSVAESELLAGLLRSDGIACEVLNARDDAREAEIIARAGEQSAVTISTNMAGRGVDIRLGAGPAGSTESVRALGGLLVIGTNRHESRRIDDQLRGRAGRQGDPGESVFYVSLRDDILERYGVGELIQTDIAIEDGDEPISRPEIRDRIERAQHAVEWVNGRIRARLAQHAAVTEEQRRAVHAWRSRVLLQQPDVLEQDDPELHRRLAAVHGADAVVRAERDVTLFHIDDAWALHLQDMRDLREMLAPMHRGRLPVGVYRERSASAFVAMMLDVRRRVVATMGRVRIDPQGADLASAGLVRPTATWTYQLADTPLRAEQYHWFAVLRSMLKDSVRR